MERYKRTAQVVERLWLLLRLAHRWLHWRDYIGADGAIARLIICRSMRFHRRSPHSIFTIPAVGSELVKIWPPWRGRRSRQPGMRADVGETVGFDVSNPVRPFHRAAAGLSGGKASQISARGFASLVHIAPK